MISSVRVTSPAKAGRAVTIASRETKRKRRIRTPGRRDVRKSLFRFGTIKMVFRGPAADSPFGEQFGGDRFHRFPCRLIGEQILGFGEHPPFVAFGLAVP